LRDVAMKGETATVTRADVGVEHAGTVASVRK
jgi:hypothetical protein